MTPRSPNLITLPVTLFGKILTGLIDLGATKSCIKYSPNLEKHKKIEKCLLSLKTADNSAIEVKGQIRVPIQIENDTYHINLIVIENLSTDLILGLDFIDHLNFQADSEFVNLNFNVYKRYDFRYIRLEKPFFTPQTDFFRLKVLNPYFGIYNGTLLIENIKKAKLQS